MPAMKIPHVPREAATAAAARIAARHRHDERYATVGDQLDDVVSFFATYGGDNLPLPDAQDDVLGALLILTHLRGQEARYAGLERRLFQQGEKARLTQPQMGEPLGLRARSAVRERIRRHEQRERGGTRTSAAIAATAQALTAEEKWLRVYGHTTFELVKRLVGAEFVSRDVGEELSYIAEDLELVEDPTNPAAMRTILVRLRELVLPDLEDTDHPAVPKLRALAAEHKKVEPPG